MITAAHFKQLQKLFWSKVTSGNNPAKVKLDVIGTIQETSFKKFTGDNKRVVTESLELSCFFTNTPTDKVREKFGVTQNTTAIVYVSPLELQVKYGKMKFPDYIMHGYSNIRAVFHGKHFELLNIREMELMLVDKEYVCLAYMITLGKDTGNHDLN